MTTGTFYRGAWTTVVCVVGGTGILLTFFALSSFAICSAGFAGAALACAFYPPLYRGNPKRATAPRRLGKVAATGTGFAWAVAGPLDLVGPSALLLAAVVAGLLVLTSPKALRRYAQYLELLRADADGVAFAAQRVRDDTAEPEAQQAVLPGLGKNPTPTSSLSLDELCRAWRTTRVLLESTEDANARSALAEVRKAYLDELERRDPVGFDRWLASDGGATTDPARFLTEAGHHSSGDDQP